MNRLDKWLFHARFCRTRLLAQTAIASGGVRLNGAKVGKPGHALKPGDVLTLRMGAKIVAVRMMGLAERRGSAAEGRALYEVLK
jgi:ribosome-associated heat shock protein Hsp15